MAAFDHLFGDPSANTTLAEGDLRRVVRRAQRLAGRGVQPAGVAGIRARAADQGRGGRGIAEALQARVVVRAQVMIREGAAPFGHAAMLRAVEEQTQQERLEQMDAARDVERPYQPGLADRQRRNLAEFNDVAELVRAWRALRT